MKVLKINRIIVFLFFFSLTLLSQKNNPTDYPYGGIIDSSRIALAEDMERYGPGLIFNNDILFSKLVFYKANFFNSNFLKTVTYSESEFGKTANFKTSKFDRECIFKKTRFKGSVDFYSSEFMDIAGFHRSKFENTAEFREVLFDNFTIFEDTHFRSTVNFTAAHFKDSLIFKEITFEGEVIFHNVLFNHDLFFIKSRFLNYVDFSNAQFSGKVSFEKTEFKNISNFRKCTFYDDIDLRSIIHDKKKIPEFINARIYKNIYIGNYNNTQIFDFRRTNFVNDDSYIVFMAPAQVKIQIEKFKHILLYDTLDYYTKKDIITNLKENIFNKPSQSKERFELDYIFEKSTLYQKESPKYELYSGFNPQAWIIFLYNATMGMGYRPFRIIWYVLSIIIIFSFIYLTYLPNKVYSYIKKGSQLTLTNDPIERYIHCLYFSAMLFFTVRFKKDLFFEFSQSQKIIIGIEWLLGLGVYLAFLTLSKAGSILHTLKSLFVG